jgi:hypothetical protein
MSQCVGQVLVRSKWLWNSTDYCDEAQVNKIVQVKTTPTTTTTETNTSIDTTTSSGTMTTTNMSSTLETAVAQGQEHASVFAFSGWKNGATPVELVTKTLKGAVPVNLLNSLPWLACIVIIGILSSLAWYVCTRGTQFESDELVIPETNGGEDEDQHVRQRSIPSLPLSRAREADEFGVLSRLTPVGQADEFEIPQADPPSARNLMMVFSREPGVVPRPAVFSRQPGTFPHQPLQEGI